MQPVYNIIFSQARNDYDGVTFSIELLEWGLTFPDFLGLRQFFLFTISKRTSMFVL